MIKLYDKKRAAQLLFLFLITLTLLGCGDRPFDHFKLSGPTMGTSYHITILESDSVETNQEELQHVIDQQLLLINQQMSTYKLDSELSLLNKNLVGDWQNVSANLFDVLMMGLELGWLTNGAFDITVGPLVELWGFGPKSEELPNNVPGEQHIKDVLQNTGFEHIEFNLENNGIVKKKPVTLDLSGIAKGYAVDKVAELLLYAGYRHFMVEIGGELRLQGHSPRGTPWTIAIEQPDAGGFGEAYQAVNVSDAGMATSGDYRNYFEKEGKRYSHTIDPANGYPIDHKLASVTVIAQTSAYADGLATAISVMGSEKGLQLAQQQDLAIYMIIKTEQGFDSIASDAFKPYLQ
jgi:thiamine biosynthesis lipoprotein